MKSKWPRAFQETISRLLCTGGLTLLLLGIWLLIPAMNSSSWPSVEGTIITQRTVTEYQSKSTYYAVAVTYQYRVGKASYQNNVYSHASKALPTSYRSREEMLSAYQNDPEFAEWQVGKPVKVYHDPQDPGQSVLHPGSSGLAWGVTFLGACLLGLVLNEWRRVRKTA
jgi:hypothetical protein